PTIGRSYSIPAGHQHLNGYNALGVVRFRHNTDGSGYPNGDLGRVQTQQAFAIALAKQMLSLGNIPNLGKIIDIMTSNLKTNLSSGNMAYYAQEFMKLSSEDITFSTMPYEPVYIRGGSYVSCQLGPWIQMLNEKLNPYYQDITEENLDILTYVNGNFYATSGVLAGGYDSFYDYTALTG
ncbi:MAG: LCP family protein, partial [Clostridiales bacterium]|nr:LCP family protein [Candidatus Apopatocola equi]